MNASGRPNTCKTSGNVVAIQHKSVVRVRNTYAIYPEQGHSSGKLELTPHNTIVWHHMMIKTEVVLDEHADD